METRRGLFGAYGAPPHRIGVYPRPRLYLTGAPTPAVTVPPTRWPQTAPPTSAGIDYAFLHEVGRRRPVRWPATEPITVRLHADPETEAEPALTRVVDELRRLTGLRLAVGDPLSSQELLGQPSPGQIQVGYISFADGLPQGMDNPGHRDTVAGLGCPFRDGRTHFTSGMALIDTARAPGRCPTAAATIGVLRHELAHVLGLAHARRASLVMHSSAAPDCDWGQGDRTGLRLLGPVGAIRQIPVSSPTLEETP